MLDPGPPGFLAPGTCPDISDAQLQEMFAQRAAGVPDSQLLAQLGGPECNGAQSFLKDAPAVVANSIFGPWIESFKQNLAAVLKTLASFFLQVPDPNVGDVNGGKSEVIAYLQGGLLWPSAVIMSFAVLVGCVRVIWEQRTAPARAIAAMILRYACISAFAIPAVAASLLIGSAYSDFIISNSTPGTTFVDNLLRILVAPGGGLTDFFLILALGVAVIVSLILCVLALIRGGAILLLLSTLLVSVAVTATDTGMETYRRHIALLVGWIVWKPVAATVFALGFRLMSVDILSKDGILSWATGVAMLCAAIWSLPTVMRMVHPAVDRVAGSRGVGATVAGVAAMTAGRFL